MLHTPRIRNDQWKEDLELKSDLQMFVEQNMKRVEVMDFVQKKYPTYAWSMRSLDLRLSFFDIRYTDYKIDLHEVRDAVQEEVNGPGQLLGYRAMHKKIREMHHLKVPRKLVYDMMEEVDPEGLKERAVVGKFKQPKRDKQFFSEGSNFTMSLDGQDKMCGFQKAMFPLCIYGGQDTFSGRINFLRIWTSNNDPMIVGKFFLEYLYDSLVLPSRIRVDKGTETGIMCTMQMFLTGDETSVLYGPSTQNKIERWWRELSHRLERFFKNQLKSLVENGDYDSTNKIHRLLLAYIYIPVLQKELDVFRISVWNNHRVRRQKDKDLPCGIPEHIFNFPERYGGENCGKHLTEEMLCEVAELSKVFEVPDYLSDSMRLECERHLPNPGDLKPYDADAAYLYLKLYFDESRV